MKRKILSYLLTWLFALLVWWCFMSVNAADDWNGWTSTTTPASSSTTTPASSSTADKSQGSSAKRKCWDTCNWIKLNTCFPIIWDCIDTGDENTNQIQSFPKMMWALTKIVMTLVLIVCFILVIYAWILWASDKPKDAQTWLKRVAITILLLWFSWVILRLINPNFFWGWFV